MFFLGGKGAFRPPKGCNTPSAGYRFPRKKGSFFLGGGKGHFAPKKGVTFHPRATDFQEKKSSASSIRIVSYCKYDMYFNKYGIDKKCMKKEFV